MGATKNNFQNKLLIAAFALSANGKDPNQKSCIKMYPYQHLHDQQKWTPISEIKSKSIWGRVRKLAYSSKLVSCASNSSFDLHARNVL